MIEDYNEYHFSSKEKIIYLSQGIFLAIAIGWLFYRNFLGIIVTSLFIPLLFKRKKQKLINNRKWLLNLEFRDGLLSIAAALSAGYSVENALEEALKDLSIMYQEDSYIVREFTYLVNQIRVNIPVEDAFHDFANRTGIEDILSFAEVFSTAKRTGGNLVEIIKSTCNIIGDKINVKNEILTLISAKKQEAGIMKIIPFGILIYLSLANPAYLEPLYNNTFGILLMSLLLIIYFVAYGMIENIININV